jgi:hypothetical protein
MADTVASQILEQGIRNLVYKFTNKSDGTGESAVTKVDVSALTPAASEVVIDWIQYDINGMEVELLWDADTDVSIVKLSSGQGLMDFRTVGGLHNNAGTGVTGAVKLTTSNHSSGDSYNLIIQFRKK